MIDFVDKTSGKEGTPINRNNMMAIQGFGKNTVSFENGQIVETNANNQKKITTFENGKIIEVFQGEKTITKTTTFATDESIQEVVS